MRGAEPTTKRGVFMDLETIYAEKAEMFRTAIDKQADEEIARSTSEIRAKKTAAGKAKAERAAAEALAQVRAERGAHEMRFKKELSRCEFETTKAVRAYRKELIDGLFEEIRGELAKYSESEAYDGYLKRVIAKAEIELGGDITILAAAKDVDRVKKLTKHEVRVDGNIALGGISALCRDKGLFADYTLDSALADERAAFTDKEELRLG